MLIFLPVLIPFMTAIFCILFWGRREIHRPLSLLGSAGTLLVALALLRTVSANGIQVLQMGNWAAPFGISFVADMLSAIMILVTAVMGLVVNVYALSDIDERQERNGYHILYQLLIMGVSGSFLTGDLFNLFVWFEIMLISSFVLLALKGERAQLEGAVKYVTMSLISSGLFLSAIGLLYALVGTLNMADIAQRVEGAAESNGLLVMAVSFLFLVAFGIKSALFPMFGWLPASYHTPPTAVTTIFGALLTKVGVYAILRTFTLLFVPDTAGVTQMVILIFAGLTMVTGVLGAVAQFDFRRLLSFHIISQIGYLVMGIGIGTTLSIAATIFFFAHVIFAKAALFLVSGVVNRLQGTYYLKKLGGLYRSALGVSMMFFIPAMALAGIPPLSGFWAKFSLIRAGLEAEQYLIVGTGLAVSILTLYSMTKIWTYAFWNKRPEPYQDADLQPLSGVEAWLRLGPTIGLGVITVLMGVFAGPLFNLALRAAEQVVNRELYITAVLGGGS